MQKESGMYTGSMNSNMTMNQMCNTMDSMMMSMMRMMMSQNAGMMISGSNMCTMNMNTAMK